MCTHKHRDTFYHPIAELRKLLSLGEVGFFCSRLRTAKIHVLAILSSFLQSQRKNTFSSLSLVVVGSWVLMLFMSVIPIMFVLARCHPGSSLGSLMLSASLITLLPVSSSQWWCHMLILQVSLPPLEKIAYIEGLMQSDWTHLVTQENLPIWKYLVLTTSLTTYVKDPLWVWCINSQISRIMD